VEASDCGDAAIDDDTVKALANMKSNQLNLFDISHNKLVTDEGLQAFDGKSFPIIRLVLTGLYQVTGKGLFFPIWACKEKLQIYEGALMD
jgi:hypothetical protein